MPRADQCYLRPIPGSLPSMKAGYFPIPPWQKITKFSSFSPSTRCVHLLSWCHSKSGASKVAGEKSHNGSSSKRRRQIERQCTTCEEEEGGRGEGGGGGGGGERGGGISRKKEIAEEEANVYMVSSLHPPLSFLSSRLTLVRVVERERRGERERGGPCYTIPLVIPELPSFFSRERVEKCQPTPLLWLQKQGRRGG